MKNLSTASNNVNKLANFVSSNSDTLLVEVVDLEGERLPSKTGRPYIQFKCYYKMLDGSESQFEYKTAHFSAGGKLLATLDISGRYQITTEVSDRGYEEWVSAVKLPDDFAYEVKKTDNRIKATYFDPLDASDGEDESDW